ncbi:uncharacterized protein LOC110702357 [Chenopodium quinoa]|uniref:uncharacterized protein LOC110702357 n=1 Tax=Chenopodium quinoa TaxID=63459 RepID=UPI000B786D69|nr:uncharacterized protein LOC110702357 [Chenopodium quinoa]
MDIEMIGAEGPPDANGQRHGALRATPTSTIVNPFYNNGMDDEDVSDDDLPDGETEEDKSQCPTNLLTKEEKRRLRKPWENTLIIKLFDRKLGYEVLVRRLRSKWSLKGDIALIDVGCSYYIVRFNNMADYDFVMTQGPRIIGDSYLNIRKWIGSKIGKVIRIDKHTELKSKGQFVRFSIEVDLTKPLLTKFRLNGRIWKIQYEGLRLICFKCGKLGHKEDQCGNFANEEVGHQGNSDANSGVHVNKNHGKEKHPKIHESYGAWMIVQRSTRKSSQSNGKGPALKHNAPCRE